jgi:hypothetical protein
VENTFVIRQHGLILISLTIFSMVMIPMQELRDVLVMYEKLFCIGGMDKTLQITSHLQLDVATMDLIYIK